MNSIIFVIALAATVSTSTLSQPPTIQAVIDKASDEYSVPVDTLISVLACESSLKQKVVGDKGTSFGIAQINLVFHPEISKEEALDAIFSINFLAREISKGRGSRWTCFRNRGYNT